MGSLKQYRNARDWELCAGWRVGGVDVARPGLVCNGARMLARALGLQADVSLIDFPAPDEPPISATTVSPF